MKHSLVKLMIGITLTLGGAYALLSCDEVGIDGDSLLLIGRSAMEGALALAGDSRDGTLPPVWLPWTTDGASPVECGASYLAGGARCKGRYCDDVTFLCRDSGFEASASWWTDYFSEEGNNERICEQNGFVTGIRCSGDYCDNISLRCTRPDNGGARGECYWSAPLSEEDGGAFVAPMGMHVAGVRCEGRYCDNKRFYLCRADNGSSAFDLEAMARTYAPRLRFDQEFGTGSGEQSKCFPGDAGDYYARRAAGADPVSLCNRNYSTIANNRVPVYYMAKRCGDDSVVIRYWYFYAWQSTCFLSFGSHAADWESLAVLVTGGELRRVAFYQHGGWYTRNAGEFETVGGTHPVAYAGKNAHGSYHDQGGSGGCLYFEDFRNPGSNDYRMDTWNNMVLLRRGAGAPDWMNCTGSGCFDGIGHPVEQTGELCGSGGCGKDGCDRTRLGGNIPFIADPTGSDYSRLVAAHSGKCLDVAGVSTDNGANAHQWACHGGDNQRWLLQYTGEGYLTLAARHSGKCLDIKGASTADGANAQQYSCTGGSNQRFRLLDRGGGLFSLQAKQSGKCLDVAEASTEDGANVHQWSCHDGDNQRYYFAR